MDAGRHSDPAKGKARTTVKRTSERELVVTRTVEGPGAHRVRSMDQAGTFSAMVGAQIVRRLLDLLRGRCSFRWRVPFGDGPLFLGAAHGVLRSIHRSHATLPPRLDQ